MHRARFAVLGVWHIMQRLTELQVAQLGLDRIAQSHPSIEQREAKQTKLGFEFIGCVDQRKGLFRLQPFRRALNRSCHAPA